MREERGGVSRSILFVIILAAVGGCAETPPPPPANPLPPPPSNFTIDGNVELNLTPAMSLQSGLPLALRVKLVAEAHSAVLTTNPMSSHHDGHLTLVVTDHAGTRTFVNIDFTVHGDSEGTPTEGLGDAINHFIDAVSLTSRSLSHLPTSNP
jgi:hypothetical protein